MASNILILREWNGRTIRQREDGYLSATDMCLACGKLFGHWNRLDSTKEYLKALQLRHYVDSHNGSFIESNVGGTSETTGTWVYRKVALRLAQWLSPEFAVQVDYWIEELLITGKVELAPSTPQTYIEALEALIVSEKARIASEEAAKLLTIENTQLVGEVNVLSEAVDELFDYSSIIRIAKFNKVSEKEFNWRKLKAASIMKSLKIKKVPCPRYGTKNLYSHDVWRYAYPGVNLPETTTLVISSNPV